MDTAQLAKALAVVKKLTRDIRGEFVGMRHWDGNKRVEHPIRIG
jgi:hypothetical protein